MASTFYEITDQLTGEHLATGTPDEVGEVLRREVFTDPGPFRIVHDTISELVRALQRGERVAAEHAAFLALEFAEHRVEVRYVGGHYPYRPECSCGALLGRCYTSRHAAQLAADEHAAGEL